ncbi:hypothetical protein hmeg3_16240 [Herbaspirillum sp. meg3]|jgi:hypothetical protein|uniref:DUF3261 domain-containing protein n=1 Tax=Herbaspirillum sp. meg3 TaxID=2025949 RepID=UPI000B97E04F|nr:DUF3261 domain-containing protein [Herbaspirillum sp. meg3]ASU39678.1 hypothetical protein hmeg3_16240 [Herbaspirillum sp. meg3]
MRLSLVISSVMAALLLSACSTAPTLPEPPATSARLHLQLAPASLGTSLSLQQHLTVERAGRTDEIDTVLEIEPDHLHLVGLAFGQRVMTLAYDGKELKTWRHFMLPKEVQGEDVLQDVQLTLWPVAAIRAALPAGWALEEKDMQRTLLLNHEVVTQIDYPDRKAWGGKVILTNLRYHYKLTIQSVVTAS